MAPSGVTDDDAVLSFRDRTCQMAVILSLGVVVVFTTVNIPPILSLSLSAASGMIAPLRHVSLSRRPMSVSYAFDEETNVAVRLIDWIN
jgi:hypothetical protein